MATQEEIKTNRTTARIVGTLFLAGMVTYITGNILVQSILTVPDHLAAVPAKSLLLAVGAMLMMLASVWDAAHGILMFPILKKYSERMAFGYLGYRIVDAVLLAVGILFILLQIPLANEYLKAGTSDTFLLQALSTLSIQGSMYAYEIAMMFVGLAGLLLCYTLYKAKLVPSVIAIWGLAGYAIHLGGSVFQVLGFDLALMHTIVGGLWELFIGVWLIAKGFNSPAFVAQSAKTGNIAEPLVPQPNAAN